MTLPGIFAVLLHLKSNVMAASKEVAKMYEGLLKIKALNANVKLDIRIPCRMTLLLAMAVDEGLEASAPDSLFRMLLSDEDGAKLEELCMEIVKKGELEEFYEQLKGMGQG
jgi:hypothetical protein